MFCCWIYFVFLFVASVILMLSKTSWKNKCSKRFASPKISPKNEFMFLMIRPWYFWCLDHFFVWFYIVNLFMLQHEFHHIFCQCFWYFYFPKCSVSPKILLYKWLYVFGDFTMCFFGTECICARFHNAHLFMLQHEFHHIFLSAISVFLLLVSVCKFSTALDTVKHYFETPKLSFWDNHTFCYKRFLLFIICYL